jgi:hypothetical protein
MNNLFNRNDIWYVLFKFLVDLMPDYIFRPGARGSVVG